MTDISNYGPVRRLSPPVSADNRKPYSRTGLKGILGTLDLNSGDTAVPTISDSPYYPFHVQTPQLEAPTQNRPNVPDGPRDIVGFPTYEQYQRIEEEYLSSLSERKQPKALISQNLFEKIFAVLQNGSEDRASTAQFRFWVRKMFVLAYPQTSFTHNTGQTPEPVVLHDKRPVAIKEQLYEVLCYCHAVARHGGRDKTCATLRLHYSWVPKELTAKFVKACPTCTLKRSGNPDLLSQFSQTTPSYVPTVPEPALLSGGPNDSSPGFNFIGSSGCGSNTGFGHSIFATPDLSVYPSPTLSSGSGGPMTPSPYLPSGLFGYPAMFDPGHNGLSSVAGWDPSPSPCALGYDEELHLRVSEPSTSADEIIDARVRGLQLRLPTPRKTRLVRNCGRPDPPNLESTQCLMDANIDPALFMEGYPPFGAVQTNADLDPNINANPTANTGTQVRASVTAGSYLLGLSATWETAMASQSNRAAPAPAPPPPPPSPFNFTLSTPMMGNCGSQIISPTPTSTSTPLAAMTMTASSASSFGSVPKLLLPPPSPSLSSPVSPPSRRAGVGTGMSGAITGVGAGAGTSAMMFMPVPMPASAAAPASLGIGIGKMMRNVSYDIQETETEMEMDVQMHERARWDSPEAWLVQSDSIDEAVDGIII